MARTTPLAIAFGALFFACHSNAEEATPPAAAAAEPGEDHQDEAFELEALSKPRWNKTTEAPRPDLTKITTDGSKVFAPTANEGTAELSIDPDVQRAALQVMRHYEIPEASVVLMDARTGRVIVYANHLQGKPTQDLAARAEAPSASVFKVVTGTALVAEAHHTPQDRSCYIGGESRITERELQPDPKRDKYCTTLAGAMGRSINTVFARYALADLKPEVLERTARSMHYGAALPFDVPVEPSQIKLPADSLGYARTAAGFWNTTLSPVHAAWISATLARGGEGVRPRVVNRVTSATDGRELFVAPSAPETATVMSKDTAAAVTEMMMTTVSEGTSSRAFHDLEGRSFLPGLHVAGKTGTLTDGAKSRYYTWFTGFVPIAGETPSVAIAALVVNGPVWKVKANVLAREVLRAYYAKQGTPGVKMPTITRESKPTEVAQGSAKPAQNSRKSVARQKKPLAQSGAHKSSAQR